MSMTVAGPDAAFEVSKLEPAGVYQEATINLRYKTITAITAPKLQRAMALLQLESRFLIKRGLASRRSLVQDLDWSDKGPNSGNSDVEASWPQNDPIGTEEDIDYIQDDQDDGWGDYEDDYDSDSDIDDDEDQDDEIEGRRKGPIYAFLVYGGVQLRPDEYVLLFRALGISPQYVEQLNQSNGEADLKPYKAPIHSHYTHPGGDAQRRGCVIGSKASPTERPSGNRFSRKEIGWRGISEKHGKIGGHCRHLLRRINPKMCPSGINPKHVSGAGSPQKPPDLLPQKQIMRKLPMERRASRLRKVVPENEVPVCVYKSSPTSGQGGCRKSSTVRDYDGGRNSYKSRSFKSGAMRRIRWCSGCRGISGGFIREKSEVF